MPTQLSNLIHGAVAVVGAAAIAELAIRPAAEFGALLVSPIYWGWGVTRGDGRSVIVLPGLFGGDSYLETLRNWLTRVGYAPVKSSLDFNPGWSEEIVHRLGEVAKQEVERRSAKVTLIGHSMGALQARSVAVRHPDIVRDVITLGSPLAEASDHLRAVVPIAALYSRSDPIVRFPRALSPDAHAVNLEVHGSHVGLVFNSEVYVHLGRRLAQTF